MKHRNLASIMASTAMFAAPATAQELAFDLEPIIVEANSLTPVDQSRSGANVEVVDGQDAGGNDDRIIDRLVRLPGVNLSTTGGLGSVGTIQVRGLPARYVGIRIDGIDVADPSGVQNQFDFGGLTASGVERVEILKGSQSAIFGSEAIGGVVNITSFEPEGLGFSGRAQAEIGSFDTYSGSVSLGHRTESGFVALSIGRIESDGISAQAFNTENDGFEQTTMNFSSEFDVTDTITLGGAVLYRDGATEIDRSSFTMDASGETFSKELGARVFATVETGATTHEISFSHFDINRDDPGGFTTTFRGDRQTLAYLASTELSANAALNFGIDHTVEEIVSGTVTGSEDNTSLTTELLFSPSDQIDLSAALRHDDNSSFGGQTTGRLTAIYRPQTDLAVRASVGTGYRAPSLFERFSAFGDPTLQPENSISYELGIEKRYGDLGYAKATVFHTDVDDLIDFDPAAVACGSGFGCYNQVPGKTTSKGIELSGEFALSDHISLFGAYTYTDAKTDGVRLTRTPRHDAVVGVSGDVSDRLSGYLDVRRVVDVVPSAFAPAGHKVGNYTLVGAGIAYDMTENSEVFLRVENLFDEDYETAGGFNQPGRAFYVGFRADF